MTPALGSAIAMGVLVALPVVVLVFLAVSPLVALGAAVGGALGLRGRPTR